MAADSSETVTSVLVAVADPDVRALLAASLTSAGFAVSEAVDGRGALDGVVARRPDALVCDLSLPGVNGYEVIQRVRHSSDRGARRMPIVVVSSRSLPADLERGVTLGASEYLPWPVDPAAVADAIRGHLSQSELR